MKKMEKRQTLKGRILVLVCILVLIVPAFRGIFSVEARTVLPKTKISGGTSSVGSVGGTSSIADFDYTYAQHTSMGGGNGYYLNTANNYLRLTDENNRAVDPGESNRVRSTSRGKSGLMLSLNHSWTYKADLIMNYAGSSPTYAMRITLRAANGDAKTFRIGYSSEEDPKAKIDSPNGLAIKGISGTRVKNLFNAGRKALTITYNAKDATFNYNIGGESFDCRSGFNKNQKVYLDFEAHSSVSKGTYNDKSMATHVYFKNFQYTGVGPQITSTKVYDNLNREITGHIGRGQTVTVKTTVKNTKSDGDYPAHLKLDLSNPVGDRIEPVTNDMALNVGKPVSVSSTGTTVSYQMKVMGNNVDASAFTQLKQILTDDYFTDPAVARMNWGTTSTVKATSKIGRHRELTSFGDNSEDPSDVEFDFGQDITPNVNGWFSKNISLRFYPSSEFTEFYVGGVRKYNGQYNITTSTPSAGADFEIYGEIAAGSSADHMGHLSAVRKVNVKLDTVKPQITLNRTAKLITAADSNSGVWKVEMRGPDTTDYQILATLNTDGTASHSVSYGGFNKLGSYWFKITDRAGNVLEKEFTNTVPEISAKDGIVRVSETVGGSVLNFNDVSVTDKEDSTVSNANVKWKLNKKIGAPSPQGSFEEITGTGAQNLPGLLPVGSYTVSYTAKDSDGNNAEQVEVTLIVTSDGAPSVINKEEGSTLEVISSAGGDTPGVPIRDTVEAEYVITAPYEVDGDGNPVYYNGGFISTEADIEKEVTDRFGFQSRLSDNNLTYTYDILQGNASVKDFGGINTKKERDYVIVYTAKDSAGNSTTLRLTCKIREDFYVTFSPGKGEFRSGDEQITEAVKCNSYLKEEQIPVKDNLHSPVERTFIGWSTQKSGNTLVNPKEVRITGDTTFYAVYAQDMNRDDVDDSLQALFVFKSSALDHGRFENDGKIIGITIEDGQSVSLEKSMIPNILFDNGYYLDGWNALENEDDKQDSAISTEELCEMDREAGTILYCKAVYGYHPPVYDDTILVTFMSSDPVNGSIDAGDGSSIELLANSDIYTCIDEGQIPQMSFKKGYSLKGWKTDDTGDVLLSTSELCKIKLFGGNRITCVAYLEYDPAVELKEAVFTFFSGDQKVTIGKGDGCQVKVKTKGHEAVSLSKNQIPEIEAPAGYEFEGWKTNVTGDRLLTVEELESLKVLAGTRVECIAVFDLKKAEVKRTGGSTFAHTLEKKETGMRKYSGLGSGVSEAGKGNGGLFDIAGCLMHWIVLLWLLMGICTVLLRIHNRKQSELPGHSDMSDWVFIIGFLIIGMVLFFMRQCIVEWILIGLGIILGAYYTVRIKMLDHRDEKRERELENSMEDIMK